MTLERITVVGASLAGLRACEGLRSDGFTGTITLVGAEPHLPYDRPPLSKKVLAGEWEPDRIVLRKPDDLATLELDMRLGTAGTSLDLDGRAVGLDDGTSLAFDGLVLATGGRVRRLPDQPELDGVCELRTLDDSIALRRRLGAGVRVVVIGAGFIGLEVAATARQAGCEVIVMEALPAPLVRGLGTVMGTVVAAVHERNGVEVRCGVRASIVGDGVVVRGVELEDGSVVPADLVVVGIGVAPATEWLEGSGLTLRDGVVCDESLCTGVPGIYAAGDITRWPHRLYDEEIRIEHWANAAEQGAAAVRNMLAVDRGHAPEPYDAVPFFWSDQYDSKIQFLGRSGTEHPDTVVQVIAGDPDTGPFAAVFGRNDRLWGVLGVNMPRVVMPFRRRLVDRMTWDDAIAAVAP